MGEFGFGQSVRRVEDDRLIVGKGQFTDDMSLPDQAYAVMVRSPWAHAKILSIDTDDARALAGVMAVYTGADAKAAGLGTIPFIAPVQDSHGAPPIQAIRDVITSDYARFVGDTLAVVIGETADIAKDGAELVVIDCEEVPAIVDTEAAAQPDACLVWQDFDSNIVFNWDIGDIERTEQAFADADHIVELKLINNRLIVNAMEPRAAIAQYDPSEDQYTLYTCSQGVHLLRDLIAGVSLNVPPEKLRVITGDVGGGFGMKTFNYPEYATILWASRELGRPVKWTADRSDSFITDTHGRDHVTDCALALDKEGRFLAIRTRTIASMGAYLSQYSAYIPTEAAAGMQVGAYDIPTLYGNVKCVLTNTVPVDAYRGAGRPEAAYVIERLIDKAATQLGMNPVALRRLNLVGIEQMPYQAANGFVLQSSNFKQTMDRALQAADWDGFAARHRQEDGKLFGRGMAYYLERAGNGPETAGIIVHPSGDIVIAAGTQSNGQGHETGYAQLVAEQLSVPFDSIRMARGDTDLLPEGSGTGGSRSLMIAGTALMRAGETIIDQGKEIAAQEFGAVVDDIDYEDGAFHLRQTNRFLSLTDAATIAARQSDQAVGLSTQQSVDQQEYSHPNGCHVCEVEIDRETGATKVIRYTVVDDFGRILNPMLVRGQVQGGIAQGLGQAMGELAIFDDQSGQLLTGSFMDYWIPHADDLPDFDISFNEIKCHTNPLGVKGCGEAGAVGSSPAFVNAMLDALRPLGIEDVDMPLTPLKIWTLIKDASR